ncbi:MAG: hypothetical protein ACTSO7_01410 [Candidatus Heimdallarchaeota archaeon]
MAKKNNKKDQRPKREPNFELFATIVLVVAVIGIIVSVVLIFTPATSGEGHAELAMYTYNDSEERYVTNDFPTSVIYNQTSGSSENITLFTKVSNQFDTAKFFQIRLKISLQDLVINEDLFANSTSSYFYEEHWKEKIFDVGEEWGPSNNTRFIFNFNSAIITQLGINPAGYKIIFELWEWNGSLADFSYTGVHTYLTSFQLVLVS